MYIKNMYYCYTDHSVGGGANFIGCILALKVLLSVAGHMLFRSSGLTLMDPFKSDVDRKSFFLSLYPHG